MVSRETKCLRSFIQKWLERDQDNHAKRLDRWASVFGKENLIVRVYEKEQLHEGILADFLAIVGLALTDDYQSPPNRNLRLDDDVKEFFRFCNMTSIEVRTRKKLKDLLEGISEELTGRDCFQPHSLLSPMERIEILRHFEESNRYVAQEYLGRKDGRLFHEPWPDDNEPWESYGGLTQEKLIQIIIKLWAAQQEDIETLKKGTAHVWMDQTLRRFGVIDLFSHIRDRVINFKR